MNRHLRFSNFFSAILFICFFSTSLLSNPLNKINFMTENYPPYNFILDGEVQGIAVDLMVLMLKRLNTTHTRSDIRILPWARAYKNVLEDNNTSLFSMTRTPKREKLFKWVGPISQTSISLIARKDNNILVHSEKEINNYKIGVVRKDIGEQLLYTLGIKEKQIESTGGIDALHKLIKMLNRNRFDLLSYESEVVNWEMKKLGFEIKDYEVVYNLSQAELFFAFHKETPDDLIQLLQKTLDDIKKEKKYEAIIQKYR